VILLVPIVEVTIAVVHDLTSKGLADGTRVGSMPIGRYSLWGVTNHSDYLSDAHAGLEHDGMMGAGLVPDR
jgi:hypothetical protein